MKVGSLGDIIFEVKSDVIKTIRGITYTGTANISTHTRHNKTGLVEYTGEAPAQVSFSMRVSKYLNADPKEAEDKLKEYVRNGTAVKLFLGTEKIGRNRWLIKSFKSSVQSTDRKGNVADVDINVSLIEDLKG